MPAEPLSRPKFNYYVDGQLFETELPEIDTALIRAKLPVEMRSYSLFSEGDGSNPDSMIWDNTKITLAEGNRPRRFYTSSPATQG